MADTVVLASAIGSTIKTVQQGSPYGQPVGSKAVHAKENVKPVGGAAGGSLNGDVTLLHEKAEVKERKELQIDILPLDESMVLKISHAIDKLTYGDNIVVQTSMPSFTDNVDRKPNGIKVKEYAPIVERKVSIDIEG